MEGEESFIALVHHDGIIKYRTKEGVRFTDKNPTNLFITKRTRLRYLQHSVLRKLGFDGRKRVSMIYYRIPISVVADGVKYVYFAIEGEADENVGDLGHHRSFGEQVVAMLSTPQLVSPQAVERVPDPLVEEALRPDDSDDEKAFIEGDSDNGSDLVPTQQGSASSSGTQQYPPHLSNVNLDALFGHGRRDGDSSSSTQAS
ncbi:hypothetical protein PIB30_065333 [Stylosanthes scabra]|uniref:Uncharacterized protein n=1 Tax=Stylosanthes scabra TaxID=79078 RepID=A0ABU6QMF1_9FABA|nr:hypothetical protein [Stylosanthes scabra]